VREREKERDREERREGEENIYFVSLLQGMRPTAQPYIWLFVQQTRGRAHGEYSERSRGLSLTLFPLKMIALVDIIGCRLVFVSRFHVVWVVVPCGWDYQAIRRNNPKDLVLQQPIS